MFQMWRPTPKVTPKSDHGTAHLHLQPKYPLTSNMLHLTVSDTQPKQDFKGQDPYSKGQTKVTP